MFIGVFVNLVPVREDGVDLSIFLPDLSAGCRVPVREDGVDLSKKLNITKGEAMVPVREDGVDLSSPKISCSVGRRGGFKLRSQESLESAHRIW